MVISVMALCVVIGCNSKKGQFVDSNNEAESIIQQTNDGINDSLKAELKKVGIEDLDAAIEAFFTDVFNERYYEDEGFVGRFCTEKLQKKLKDAYEYDGEDGYATWKFRSDAQDGPSEEYKLVKFVPEGNGWYKYDYIDMGVRGSHRIKFITHVNPRDQVEFYIDDIE